MVSVRALLLKMTYEMTEVFVAGMGLVCLSEMCQDLPLVDRPLLSVALGA